MRATILLLSGKRQKMNMARGTTPGRSHHPVCGAVRWVGAVTPGNRTRFKPAAQWNLWILVAVCLLTLVVAPVNAQTGETEDLKRQVDELRAENAALKQEVAELRSALNNLLNPPEPAADQPPTARISIAGLASRGQPNAPVTMVVFSDYQSQLSARYLLDTHPQIVESFVQPGTVRYVFKNFPVLTAHPQALKAHEAGACAGDQGRYWEMHDLLFANQSALAMNDFIEYARSLELDSDLFRYCLTSNAHAATIRRDVDEGRKGGVTLTPVFAIGLTEPNAESMEVMEVVIGVQPYATFEEAIEAVLEAAKIDR